MDDRIIVIATVVYVFPAIVTVIFASKGSKFRIWTFIPLVNCIYAVNRVGVATQIERRESIRNSIDKVLA